MTPKTVRENSLVLYKAYPARVIKIGEKVEIELSDGETLRVRPKDISLLHPGPLQSFSELRPQTGEPLEAWELMAGGATQLNELAELIYGQWTPASSWAAWQLVAEGLYFRGTPDKIEARSREEVEKDRLERETKAVEAQAWEQFLQRVRAGKFLPEERKYLADVEAVALGRATGSRLMRELGTHIMPENAHALLYRLKYWDETVNPYPSRMDVTTRHPDAELAEMAEEERLDLTHLAAYAIDDEGSKDPDDAISLEGDRIWVHVADAAALIPPDSPADREARHRGANLYLPEQTIPMLPARSTELLGLGLQPLSPALSFGMVLGENGEIRETQVVLSRVKVTRLTYESAEARLEEEPFRRLFELTRGFHARRLALSTARLDLPEVKIRVEDGQLAIRPLPSLRSRELVTEAMLMAGEAAARFALARDLPFPFTTQSPPDGIEHPKDMAAMFAYRRKFKRSTMKSSPEPHAGLGLEVYARATSPLRRYLDLVVHQQLRAFLQGRAPLNTQEMLERVGAAEAVIGNVQRAERLSNLHWTMVFLQRHPDWRGKGILVEKRDQRGIVLLPELALEAKVYLSGDPPLNTELGLRLASVDLPGLVAHFKIV